MERLRAGFAARQRVPAPREAGCRDQPTTLGHPPDHGHGDRAAGEASHCNPRSRIGEEGWGGRAGQGGRLEDARLSESSQSTLTR